MNEKQKQFTQEFLNERWEIAVDTDKRMGNTDEAKFLSNNPDYIYYQACLDILQAIGFDWKRNNGKHIIFD